ncbi:fructose-1,6-bisphosphatase [Paraburkholderia sp. GAS38]|jgi:fructose-1,6-bisphosphatase|uniref:class 1 fructose-bisphosphatase n=1 Tax=Paraburkholderia sp. GAS38 TaxID=3035133 RepID=UPI003D2534CE
MTHIATTEHITLSSFLADAAREERVPAGLIALIDAVADACSSIATAVERGAFDGASGNAHSENVHGEAQKKLDVVSNDIMIGAVGSVRCLRGLASEELDSVQVTGHEHSVGAVEYLLLFDPLDGSSNLEINGVVGSIFSVLATPASGAVVDERHFLQPGVKQVCAGYAIYGATTMFVLTTGHGVDGFTFDGESASFVLTHPQLQIPEDTREFAINMSNERYWEEPVRRYVRECVAGESGPRQTNFNMRWIASMVAEVHRILMRGGVFLYPRDNKHPQLAGRLRLTYEANPMSFIVEQAGGMSTTGQIPIMEVQPEHVHQRVPVILGSKLEVERLLRYHDEAAAA